MGILMLIHDRRSINAMLVDSKEEDGDIIDYSKEVVAEDVNDLIAFPT
jgi:hypothetical protein